MSSPSTASKVRYFEAPRIGNVSGGPTIVQSLQTDSSVYLTSILVVEDDKKGVILGVQFTYSNGHMDSAGNSNQIANGDVKRSTINFIKTDTLTSVSTYDSGFGHGSLRRIEINTNGGQTWGAGPLGADSCISPPVAKERIVGFYAVVNSDNFINAFAFRFSSETPLNVQIINQSLYAPVWDAASGQIKFTGTSAVITIEETTTNLVAGFPRAVIINKGKSTAATIGWGASAPLRVAIWNDATFEAKFDILYGSGSTKGIVDGLKPSTNSDLLREALVLKYAPKYVLNWDETYWQSSVEHFIGNMVPWNGKKVITDPTTGQTFNGLVRTDLSSKVVPQLGADNTNQTSWLQTFSPDDDPTLLDGNDHTKSHWFWCRPDYPIFSYVVVSESGGNVSFTYWFLFNYNEGKKVGKTWYENHVGDWEHIRVDLTNCSWVSPGHEQLVGVAHNAHGNWDPVPLGDQFMELHGYQVVTHLSNGGHEPYSHAHEYSITIPVPILSKVISITDYCKTNGRTMDTRTGSVEIYQWNGQAQNFTPPSSGAIGVSTRYKSPDWITYRGRWGNPGSPGVASWVDGPEGLYRPGEYVMPPPYKYGPPAVATAGTTAATVATGILHV